MCSPTKTGNLFLCNFTRGSTPLRWLPLSPHSRFNSQLAPFCVQLACSSCVCVGSVWLCQFPAVLQRLACWFILFQHRNNITAPRQAHCGNLKPGCILATAAWLICSTTQERSGHHLTKEEKIQKERCSPPSPPLPLIGLQHINPVWMDRRSMARRPLDSAAVRGIKILNQLVLCRQTLTSAATGKSIKEIKTWSRDKKVIFNKPRSSDGAFICAP